MMEATDNLQLPYLMPNQAQKHVTHNEALAILDAIVQLAVLDCDLTSPPDAPEDGDRHIVAAGATGAWVGQDFNVAVRRDGAWVFLVPRTGWLAFVADEGEFFHFAGSAWESVAGTVTTLQNLGLLGVGTAADASNPFSAKLNKALWAARSSGEGGDGDLRYTMNKEAAGNVLSLLLQSGWSGRAELGLIGGDDFTLKVSPNGTAWTTAVSIDRSSGAASFVNTLTITRNGAAASVVVVRPDGIATSLQAGTTAARFSFEDTGDFIVSDNARAHILAGTNGPAGRDFIKCISSSGAVDLCAETAGALTMHNGNVVIDTNRHHRLRSYTVGTLPSASPAAQAIYVSDGTSNKRLAISDGTDWRFPDGAVVS